MKKLALLLLPVVSIAAVLAGVILVPSPASASINAGVWINSAYKGTDSLYGAGAIVAYVAGDNATLKVGITNDTGNTINIKGAKVKFDWTGGEYKAATADYPSSLLAGLSGEATINFTVPATSVASNTMRHSYTISVDYEKEGGYKASTAVVREDVGTGDGSTKKFNLDHQGVDPDPTSISIFVGTGGIPMAAADYTLDCFNGVIYFNSAPNASFTINADYQYVELVGAGNGVTKDFWVDNFPVVSGTDKIYQAKWDSTNLRYSCVALAYSLDSETGKITFTTAPEGGTHPAQIMANYQYYKRYPQPATTSTDFVVYTTEQGAAMDVRQQLLAIGSPSVSTAKSRELMAQSAMETSLGDQDYKGGNFVDAKTRYDQAFSDTQDALKIDKDNNGFNTHDPTGILLRGIGYLVIGIGVILGVVVLFMRRPRA
ncbi:MAG: hypothetical protein NTZ04_04915 [Chloroflexi bacterium]|nr:hypothetical protein [Chloroflexota bacterium]